MRSSFQGKQDCRVWYLKVDSSVSDILILWWSKRLALALSHCVCKAACSTLQNISIRVYFEYFDDVTANISCARFLLGNGNKNSNFSKIYFTGCRHHGTWHYQFCPRQDSGNGFHQRHVRHLQICLALSYQRTDKRSTRTTYNANQFKKVRHLNCA